MKNRILPLVLFIAMCLSLLTITAFADYGPITGVDITLPALTGGKTVASVTPVCTAKAGDAALNNVVFLSADWEENNGTVWEPLTAADTFEADRTYRLTNPLLYLAGGYTFDSSVTVTLNGKEVTPTVNGDFVYLDSQVFTASCTVSFEMNGRGTAPDAQFDADGFLLEPAAPVDDTYAFAGWFTDAGLTRPMAFPAKLTADTTLYASWKLRVRAVDITVTQAKYTQPSVALEASYTADGSTANTSSVFAQYTSKSGSSWKQIRYTHNIEYDTQNKIEFTVSLTDSDVRMIDALTAVTVHGAEGASCEIQRTADSVKITVVYVLPPRKFTVKFDTEGHTPPIPDQEVDALSAITMPDMSAYTDGAWRFQNWTWGGDAGYYWHSTDAVWEDIVLKANWDHYAKVTFVMSSTGEELGYWFRADNMMNYWLKELENDGRYYIREVYADKKMTQEFRSTTHITDNITLYADAPLIVRELRFELEEPSDGKTMTPAVRITYTNPQNSVIVDRLGQWYVSDDGQNWRAMQTGEKYAGGHYYYYSEMDFRLSDGSKYYFHYRDIDIRRNGVKCDWVNNIAGLVGKAYYTLPAKVEFDLNGRGRLIPPQEVQPRQTAARPEDPAAFGWQFTGWYTDKDCTTLYDFETPVNSNLLLYAGWEPRIETVDADFALPWLHCKAGSDVSSLIPNHTDASLSASRILWRKNNGSGWTVMNPGEEFLPGTEYRAEFTVIADSKIPFAANVQASVHGNAAGVTCSLDASGNLKIVYTKLLVYTTHEVTFDTEGKGAPLGPQTVEEGLPVPYPTDPTAEGYAFEGWYSDAAHTKRFDMNTPIVEDLTLYAHWQRLIHKVTVTLPDIIAGQTAPNTVQLTTEHGMKGLRYYKISVAWQKDSGRSQSPWSGALRFEDGQDYTVRRFTVPVVGSDWLFADDLEIDSSAGTVEVLFVSRTSAEIAVHISLNRDGTLPPTPDDPTPANPPTGDNSATALWVSLLCVGGAALTAAFWSKKKKREYDA